jgi:hypothetical protein
MPDSQFPHPLLDDVERYLRLVAPRLREHPPAFRRPIVSMPEPVEQDDAGDLWDSLGDFA